MLTNCHVDFAPGLLRAHNTWGILPGMKLGDAIRIARKRKGLSLRATARRAEVDAGSLSRIEAGLQLGRGDTLARIATVLEIESDLVQSLLAGENVVVAPEEERTPATILAELQSALKAKAPLPELPHTTPMPGLTGVVLVPIVSEVSAGGGFTAPDGYVAMTPPKGASSSLVSFTIRGYCMSPQIEPGDTVVVDLDREWRDGSIVLARRDGDIHVKRLLIGELGMRLHADADGYTDITDGFAILGVVIRVEKVPR